MVTFTVRGASSGLCREGKARLSHLRYLEPRSLGGELYLYLGITLDGDLLCTTFYREGDSVKIGGEYDIGDRRTVTRFWRPPVLTTIAPSRSRP